MTAFRPLDPFQVYTDLTGKLAVGGNLHFYAAGTTTDADVYGDEALSINNGPTITIGTDGRATNDIWADGTLSYRCRVYASDGTLIRDRDNIGLPGSGALTIPPLTAGDFMTNDGSSLLWGAIRQALDPSGAANKIMGSDGTNLVWIDKPSDGTAGTPGTNANITLGANSITMNNGTGDLWYVQWGSASAPASGTHTTSKDVAFPTAFKEISLIVASVTSSSFASAGYQLATSTINKTTSGFTLFCDTNSSDGSNGNIISAVPFDWIAFGTKAGT